VTAADFREKVLRADGPVAVEFMSFACGYCRRANPMVHDVARALGARVKVFQVNVPQERELSDTYRIRATPTFVMFENGREVGRANPEISPIGIRTAILAPFGD
jgi:thioredoxin 1